CLGLWDLIEYVAQSHTPTGLRLRQAALSRLEKNAHRLVVTCVLTRLFERQAIGTMAALVGCRAINRYVAWLMHIINGKKTEEDMKHPLLAAFLLGSPPVLAVAGPPPVASPIRFCQQAHRERFRGDRQP